MKNLKSLALATTPHLKFSINGVGMRFFKGFKQGVGGVVKVMKNNNDDPLATPNNHYGKFRFNSETTKIGYILGHETLGRIENLPGGTNLFYPGGSNQNTCLTLRRRYSSSGSLQWAWYFPSRANNTSYIPISEYRNDVAMGEFQQGPRLYYSQIDNTFDGHIGEIRGTCTYAMSFVKEPYMTGISYPTPVALDVPVDTNSPVARIFTFGLPCDDSPLPAPNKAAAGARNLIISPTMVRIAAAGASCDTNRYDDLIISSDKVPMKIAKAGQINIARNQTIAIPVDVTLSQNTYLDYMVWQSNRSPVIPIVATVYSSSAQSVGFEYAINPNNVIMKNYGDTDITVRYVIFFDDGISRSGGSKVFENLPDGHIRIKRPGSSDTNPGSKDVLLDTRRPYMPIVAEGVINSGDFKESATNKSFGSKSKTINFTNDGSFYPFVKLYSISRNGNINVGSSKVLIASGRGGGGAYHLMQHSGGAVAEVFDASVKFTISPDAPYTLEYSYRPTGDVVKAVYRDWLTTDKIRYYIFAIPKEL